MAITLRTFAHSDLDALFTWESDPRAVQMAAFTRANPSDRSAFDAHYERVRSDPSNTLLAIDDDGEFVGTIGSFTREGEREVTYWIAPARWGQGLASRALRAFLAIESTRPLYGRVASHNAASAKVLARAGFVEVGSETSFAPGVAPRSSSASIDSIDRRLIPTVNDRAGNRRSSPGPTSRCIAQLLPRSYLSACWLAGRVLRSRPGAPGAADGASP
jgi:RimJ/RimL family protein N-acetyltransferase